MDDFNKKKTARMMTRVCSKGMFNDFFGQWNAHVHCWCNTNKNNNNNSVLCHHSHLNLISCFNWNLKMEHKMSGVPYTDWPVEGEPALTKEQTKRKLHRMNQSTDVHDYLQWPLPLMHSWHSNFHWRKWRRGWKPSPIIKVSWAQTKRRHSRVIRCKH